VSGMSGAWDSRDSRIAAEALRIAAHAIVDKSYRAFDAGDLGERLGADWAAAQLFEIAGDFQRNADSA